MNANETHGEKSKMKTTPECYGLFWTNPPPKKNAVQNSICIATYHIYQPLRSGRI